MVWCSTINFLYTLALILPTACLGYRAFGDSVTSNLLDQLPEDHWSVKASCVLLAAHMVVAYAVLLIPVIQSAESAAGIPLDGDLGNEAKAQSVAIRLGISCMCVLVAVAFPFFNQICGMVSSIAASAITFWGPPILWLCATDQSKDLLREEPEWRTQTARRIAYLQFIVTFAICTMIGLYASSVTFAASIDHMGIFAKNGAT